MNTGQIVKSKSSGNYTIIPNAMVNDVEMSLKAKGLLVYLLSLPTDWVIYKSEIQNHHTDGRDSVASAFKELEIRGYILSIEIRNSKGHFKGFNYIVYENPKTENPKLENQPLLNTNNTNTNNINNKKVKKPKIDISGILPEKEDLLIEWINYRKAIKKPLKQISIGTVIKKFNKTPKHLLEEAIEKSIENSYQGLFIEKEKVAPKRKNYAKDSSYD